MVEMEGETTSTIHIPVTDDNGSHAIIPVFVGCCGQLSHGVIHHRLDFGLC